MRRALRASRLVASVVATFIYLAFEEAVRASQERAAEARTALDQPRADATNTLSVHDRPTLPGTVEAPIRDLVAMSPVIRVIEPAAAPPRPAVLFEAPDAREREERAPDVATLLSTLRRDVGCTTKANATHEACRAAETLGDLLDRDAVLEALEETVTAARRPDCVRRASARALGRSSRAAARSALLRMLAVARGRAEWSGSRTEKDLVALLLRTLDAAA